MLRSILTLLLLWPLSLSAQSEATLLLNLKKHKDADTLIIALRSLKSEASTLCCTLPAKGARKVSIPMDEAHIVIMGIQGDTSACRAIVQPGEKVSISGKMREGKALCLHKLSVSGNGQSIQQEQVKLAYTRTLVGNKAQAIVGKSVSNEDVQITLAGTQARYTLIDFWASWCQPCHAEIPNLKAIYKRFHTQGLDFIGISTDRNVEDWRCSLQEVKEPWPNYIDQARHMTRQYEIKYIPSIFVVDNKGIIVADKIRGKELSQYIERLFRQ